MRSPPTKILKAVLPIPSSPGRQMPTARTPSIAWISMVTAPPTSPARPPSPMMLPATRSAPLRKPKLLAVLHSPAPRRRLPTVLSRPQTPIVTAMARPTPRRRPRRSSMPMAAPRPPAGTGTKMGRFVPAMNRPLVRTGASRPRPSTLTATTAPTRSRSQRLQPTAALLLPKSVTANRANTNAQSQPPPLTG
ncbi:hypothetical protein LP7551_01906 [Roseibium album]|nr:hypothetical protein LP7551_01906 [Roseibium album]